jgi:hypothetical protein
MLVKCQFNFTLGHAFIRIAKRMLSICTFVIKQYYVIIWVDKFRRMFFYPHRVITVFRGAIYG